MCTSFLTINGRVEGAICNFMLLHRKVLALLRSSQELLLKAQLFIPSWQLPLPLPMGTALFSQDLMGLEENAEVIWSFLQLSGWMGTLDRCPHCQAENWLREPTAKHLS